MGSPGGLAGKEKKGMAKEKREVCCMFEEKNPDLAVKNRDLERVATLWESSRREQVLFRCRRCGAYVFYDYEEIANLYGGWDNADIFERYIPARAETTVSEDGETEYSWSQIKGARWIYGHNLEEDAERWYLYEGGKK